MTLTVVGASHRTAPIPVRERLHVDERARPNFLASLGREAGVEECVVLSTCNRSEVYLHATAVERAREAAVDALARHAGLERAWTEEHLYLHHGREAVRHLFRVTSGLDSMVVGEPEIQGQVGEAYEGAREAGDVGPVLHRLFQTALAVGGEVRARTAVGEGAASVPSAAVKLVTKVFGSLEGRRAVVVGAGEMGRATLTALLDRGVAGAVVASRTAERAEVAASRARVRPVPYEEVWGHLEGADIVVTSTSAPHQILTAEALRSAGAGDERPLVVMDIAVPRDVEPAAAELAGIFLYNIDDLQQVVEGTRRGRDEARDEAEGIVVDGVGGFWDWYRAREAVPIIRAVRQEAERIRRRELEEAMEGMEGLTEAERKRIHHASRLVLKKVLHAPTVGLRELAAGEEGDEVLRIARRLFDVDAGGPERAGRDGDGGAEDEGGGG